MNTRYRSAPRSVALGIALGQIAVATLWPATAGATEIEARIDPGVAFAVSSPQSSRFGPGGGTWLGAGLPIVPYVEWQAAAGLLALSGDNGPSVGEAFALGTGPRVQRPRQDGWSPWVDADAMYVHTSPLDRFGVGIGAGVSFPLTRSRVLWLGPAVHYLQIVQLSDAGANANDARILMAGISVEGWFHPPPTSPEGPPPDVDGDGLVGKDDLCPTAAGPVENHGCPDVDTDGDTVVDRLDRCPKEAGPVSNQGCPIADHDGDGIPDDVDRCPDAPGPRALQGCPDRDKDGVPDADDRCPDVAGPPENHGCPEYKLVTVTDDRVKIGQKILFAFGTTNVLPKSFPLLTEVAQALHDHATIEVRIEGHTDSVGDARHNTVLSQGRADAVRRILVDKGVAANRLTAVGYGQTMPIDTNKTVDGREANRRVEFVITGGTTTQKLEPASPPPVK